MNLTKLVVFHSVLGQKICFGAYFEHHRYVNYCTISINSAGPVTRDRPAENLVSATSQSYHDIPKFLGNFRQFSAAGDKKICILVT